MPWYSIANVNDDRQQVRDTPFAIQCSSSHLRPVYSLGFQERFAAVITSCSWFPGNSKMDTVGNRVCTRSVCDHSLSFVVARVSAVILQRVQVPNQVYYDTGSLLLERHNSPAPASERSQPHSSNVPAEHFTSVEDSTHQEARRVGPTWPSPK